MKDISRGNPYHFADFVRFFAMCAIIFQHSFLVDRELLSTDYPSVVTFFSLKVMAKIGSISFFLISGFLLSSALERYSAVEYLQKRVKNILKPYLLFFGAYLLLDSLGAFVGKERIDSLASLPGFFAGKAVHVLFFTSYWFIFNYFISVMILLLFRKHLYEQWLGIVLFSLTAIYAINVHMEWFLPHHTTAFVGFTFFLWLGANLKSIEQHFIPFIRNTPYWKFIIVVAIALLFNLWESLHLIGRNALVVDSSLKATNIAYSLSVFLLLCKIGMHVNFRWLNPREETYPLYLVHPILLKVICYGVLPLVPFFGALVTINDVSEVHWLAILVYQIGWFVSIYVLSLVLVRKILRSNWRWVFGRRDGDQPRSFPALFGYNWILSGIFNTRRKNN